MTFIDALFDASGLWARSNDLSHHHDASDTA